MDGGHCAAVAFGAGISAVLVDSALAHLAVVVRVYSSPEVALDSVAIVLPRLIDDDVQFERCAETVVLMQQSIHNYNSQIHERLLQLSINKIEKQTKF